MIETCDPTAETSKLPLPLTCEGEESVSPKQPLAPKLRPLREDLRYFIDRTKAAGSVLLEPLRYSAEQIKERGLKGVPKSLLICLLPVAGAIGAGFLTDNETMQGFFRIAGGAGGWLIVGNCLKDYRAQSDWQYPLS